MFARKFVYTFVAQPQSISGWIQNSKSLKKAKAVKADNQIIFTPTLPEVFSCEVSIKTKTREVSIHLAFS